MKAGRQVLGFLVVARAGGDAPEYAIHVRTSWLRGYRILRTWRGKADRTYRTLDKLYKLPFVFGYLGPVTVYPAGCVELGRFRGVLAHDVGTHNAGDRAVDSGDGKDHPAAVPW